jgi:hypothetical protein
MNIEEALSIETVRATLAQHYRQGVAAAVATYPQHRADEDTVTGALGQALAGRGTIRLPGGEEFDWITSYQRFRSAPGDAPEPRLGGDGIFEIQVIESTGVITRKSLTFQAKNNTRGLGDARLRSQARKISDLPGGGIVINYGEERFAAVDAGEVSRREAGPLSSSRSLQDVLAEEFVPCLRGSTAYYYDALTETIVISGHGSPVLVRRLPLSHRIRTTLISDGVLSRIT